MSDSSIIPERQLVFSPGLAQAIGLEEAVLLQQLADLFRHRDSQTHGGRHWLRVERAWLLKSLPFWSAVDLHRVCRSLEDKGLILTESPPLLEADALVFALNETPARPWQTGTQAADSAPTSATPGAGLIGANWSPEEDLLQLLQLNHGISRQFALNQLEDFICYWRERAEVSHAWGNKFRQHVLTRWRQSQQDEGERFRVPDRGLDEDWFPSADAVDLLIQQTGVTRAFIEDAVPEFVLYWRERNPQERGLNSKFVQHVRRQWARYTSALKHDTEPQRIPDNWQPSEDVYDILRLSHIDPAFAESLLPEFVLFWKESNALYQSWNTKFLQHVKYHWARRDDANERQQDAGGSGRTRDRSLAADLSDRSWAS
ncbi:MAG: DnaT-like ssDNA-binding domain-containing protein [Pseudomonadota bacterium]